MENRRFKKAFKRIANLPFNKYLLFYLANKIKFLFFMLSKSTEVAYPSTILLEIESYCGETTSENESKEENFFESGSGEMSVSNAKIIIDETFPYLDTIELVATGKSINSDNISTIIDYIISKKHGISISLSINSCANENLDILKSILYKIDTLELLCSGLEEHANAVEPQLFSNAHYDNIKNISAICKETETLLKLKLSVTNNNYRLMPQLILLAEKAGVQNFEFIVFNMINFSEDDYREMEFYKSDDFRKTLIKVIDIENKNRNISVSKINFGNINGFKKCAYPWSNFYVGWNGNVLPCFEKIIPNELNFGNVFEKNVLTILNSYKFRKFRIFWYAGKIPYYCQNCYSEHLHIS